MANTFSVIDKNDVIVMGVETTEGVKGAVEAFKKLESKLPTLKKRRFYGVLFGNPNAGFYRACVELTKQDDPNLMGLERWTIPGGKYARAKIKNWEENTSLIGPTFSEMAKKYRLDETRPAIEFYRSQEELILFSPIKD